MMTSNTANVDRLSIEPSAEDLFARLVSAAPPKKAEPTISTACVLGGSIAGLLAARVLSDHAEHVVVVERDDVGGSAGARAGTPHATQLHILLPAGAMWMERWLSGFTTRLLDAGAIVGGTRTTLTAVDGLPQALSGRDYRILCASRNLLESCVRASVVALPNVELVTARATGVRFHGPAVRAVEYSGRGSDETLPAEFVVDAMGRSSRMHDWLRRSGFDEPRLERLPVPLSYATGYFERRYASTDLEVLCALATYGPGRAVHGVSIGAASVKENDQWMVALIGYEPDRPGGSIDEFRAAAAGLPPVFGDAVRGGLVGDIVRYRQTESRRRFAPTGNHPSGLVAVGDAVASFNPVYGQGMSSAALHASCLSTYLTERSVLDAPPARFFDMQQVVVDAAWSVSAGGDSARLVQPPATGTTAEPPRRRWAQEQVLRASLRDPHVAGVFKDVSYMLRHPAALTDPLLLERALAVNAGD